MANLKWSELNHLQIGRYAEYYAKMELTSYGYHIFTSEVDDHGVDFVMKNHKGDFFEVQVKSARISNTNYVFATKEKFNVENEKLLMALVLLEDDKIPEMYLIPARAWKNESELFKDKEYEGKKSKPEWGLNISKKNRKLLIEYEVDRITKNLNYV